MIFVYDKDNTTTEEFRDRVREVPNDDLGRVKDEIIGTQQDCIRRLYYSNSDDCLAYRESDPGWRHRAKTKADHMARQLIILRAEEQRRVREQKRLREINNKGAEIDFSQAFKRAAKGILPASTYDLIIEIAREEMERGS